MSVEGAGEVPFGTDDASVLTVAFSPDGAIVASGSDEGDVRLRDASTGQLLARFLSDSEAVWSMAFSPDGATLVAGEKDGSVRTWDTGTARNAPGPPRT